MVDQLYSIDYYCRVLLRSDQDPTNRLLAHVGLAAVPHSAARFGDEIQEAWLREFNTSDTDNDRLTLLRTLPAVANNSTIRRLLLYNLLNATSSEVRKASAQALRNELDDRDVRDAFAFARRTDPSREVRRTTEICMRTWWGDDE